MEIMYTRRGITGSNPVLSADKNMRRINLIILLVLMFFLGLTCVEIFSQKEKKKLEVKVSESDPESLSLNDSISMRQVRRMDSLHAAGKL